MRQQLFYVRKQFSVANFLGYQIAKNFSNLLTNNKVIAKTKRVPVLFKHSVIGLNVA